MITESGSSTLGEGSEKVGSDGCRDLLAKLGAGDFGAHRSVLTGSLTPIGERKPM